MPDAHPARSRDGLSLESRGRTLDLQTPRLMGIVNINDDSFCGDGSLQLDEVWQQAMQQLEDGADIIDIGAESARTNRDPIPWQQEVERLMPFLQRWQAWSVDLPTNERPWLSINTWRPQVIDAVLPVAGDVVNDMSALPGPENAALCARHGVVLLIMHSVGQPKQPHHHVRYPDIMAALREFFTAKIQLATEAGLSRRQLILDPGIDFAKSRDDNLTLLNQLSELTAHDIPILLPVSRKTVIGQVLDRENPLDRDPGTVACLVAGLLGGASLFRLHNVVAARDTLATLTPILPDSNH